PRLIRLNQSEQAALLTERHSWFRSTAQRLLSEMRSVGVPHAFFLMDDLREIPADAGWANRLWTMADFGVLSVADIRFVLDKGGPADRIHALRLAEPYFAKHPEVENCVLKVEDDPSPFVRFQLALTAGKLNPNLAGPLLGRLLRRPDAARWLGSAALSSAKDAAPGLLAELAVENKFASAHPATLGQLAGMVGARGKDEDTLAVLTLLGRVKQQAVQLAILEGLGDGMRSRDASLGQWLVKARPDDGTERFGPFFRQAAETARNEKSPPASRLAAVRLLGYAPFKVAGDPLAELLSPRNSTELQAASLRALTAFDDPKVAGQILAQWDGY